MTMPYLEISFRHGIPFAAYIHRGVSEKAASTRDLGHGLLLDAAADGHVIGVEITNPHHVDTMELSAILAQHGVVVPVDDLAPLTA